MPRPAPRPFRYRIEVYDDHIVVWQAGTLQEHETAELQSAIESAMRVAGVRRAIFDNRETDRPDEMVRALMWTWLGACTQLERLALVLELDRNTRRARETADRNRVTVSAFSTMEEAVAWLRA